MESSSRDPYLFQLAELRLSPVAPPPGIRSVNGFKAPPGQAERPEFLQARSGQACSAWNAERRRNTHLTAPSPSSHSLNHITRSPADHSPHGRTEEHRTGGGDIDDQPRPEPPAFGLEVELVLGRNNGGNDLSFSPCCAMANDLTMTEKLKLGSPQTPAEGRSKKRRAANVGHYQPDVGPDQFLRIVFKPTFSRLRIPQDFIGWVGEIPLNIILKTNTGCNWRMTTAREGDDVYIDQGWAAFAIAHQLQVGQFLIFKRVSSFEYSVVIFDYTCTEVMTRTNPVKLSIIPIGRIHIFIGEIIDSDGNAWKLRGRPMQIHLGLPCVREAKVPLRALPRTYADRSSRSWTHAVEAAGDSDAPIAGCRETTPVSKRMPRQGGIDPGQSKPNLDDATTLDTEEYNRLTKELEGDQEAEQNPLSLNRSLRP
ncbi:hypothetical protein QYE76_059713 [Lolium multiflorum]|uniref:TF-B3 domain-containing protein n=1 Tax=Lolium multiflorum TaxID=4521 RepID=A0AAD8RZ60_LOLMU|nr:hypothetical protein QYE76_059713 [Lolium multiflorum]